MNSLANVCGDLYTFSNNDMSGKSLIDVIVVSKNLVNNILFAKITDSGVNLSDHRPVLCNFFYYDSVLPVVSGGVSNGKIDKVSVVLFCGEIREIYHCTMNYQG